MIGVIFKPLDTSYASSEASLDPCLELSSTIRYTPSLSVTYPSTLSLTFLVTFLPIHLLTLSPNFSLHTLTQFLAHSLTYCSSLLTIIQCPKSFNHMIHTEWLGMGTAYVGYLRAKRHDTPSLRFSLCVLSCWSPHCEPTKCRDTDDVYMVSEHQWVSVC